MTNLHKLLSKLGACNEAVKWSNGKTLSVAWNECDRADWMLWLVGNMAGREGWPTRQQIMLVACLIAEDALPIFEKKYPDDDRVRKCIEVTRAWAKGETTIEQVREARAAAARFSKLKEYADLVRRELKIPMEQVDGKAA